MKTVVFLLCVCVLALLWLVVYLLKRQERVMDVLAKQAVKISGHESSIFAYEEVDRHSFKNMLSEHEKKLRTIEQHIEQIDKKMDGLPVEDIGAQYEAEKAWNEGVQAIVNYGLDKLKGSNE